PIFVAQLTGWYPTRETILVQVALALIYVLGAVWTFVVLPRREQRAEKTRPEVPATDVPETEGGSL
ncbi:MAG: hypothetical protein M3161_05525, partial [Actinomycetota bacterium]|nr:hypothetical protein [Actinomycetota bacterium]